MKKILYLLPMILLTFTGMAQSNQVTPQVQVSGEGSMKIKPDYAQISIGVEIKDVDATKTKKENDKIIAKMIQIIKESKIEDKDFQTQRVHLYKSRDYQEKIDYFVANQTISITLRNLNNYEKLMSDLIQVGANNIQGVEFKSTETEKYASEIRAKAVLDAKKKAEDYAGALNQSIGKAILISDQSSIIQPRVYSMKAASLEADSLMQEQTLAVGEIEISTNVSISFELK